VAEAALDARAAVPRTEAARFPEGRGLHDGARALCAVGARLGSPKPAVLCPWDSERRKRTLAGLRRLARNATAAEPVF
jgi:hypothetical protein